MSGEQAITGDEGRRGRCRPSRGAASRDPGSFPLAAEEQGCTQQACGPLECSTLRLFSFKKTKMIRRWSCKSPERRQVIPRTQGWQKGDTSEFYFN